MILQDFLKKKQNSEKITMLTCYDYSFARIIDKTSIDSILVGDSLAAVMYGEATTLAATVALMVQHIRAVARGCKTKFIVGDMPFMSYRKGLTANVSAVEEIMRAGAHGIKLEGCHGNLELIEHIVESGVPVMGHLGLTPQMIHLLGGHRVQGKSDQQKILIKEQAMKLQDAGCFAIVLECVPTQLAKEISEALEIPTIGIGAGLYCNGQILVLQDLLGMNLDFKPKFLRTYMDGHTLISSAIEEYCRDTRDLNFPSSKESYL